MDIIGRYVDIFCNAVIDKGDGLSSNDSDLFTVMKDSLTRLHNHPSGYFHISKLLYHKNHWVQSWIAAQLLSESNNKEAEKTLEKLAQEDGILGFSSTQTLKEYKNGKLQSPFGILP